MKHTLELTSVEVIELLAFLVMMNLTGRVPSNAHPTIASVGHKLLALREAASEDENREAANA